MFCQPELLKKNIQQLLDRKNASVGISVSNFENGDTLNINGNRHFPMQSVFKLHIALAVLDQVDKGKFTLEQPVFIKKSDLLPATWSPLRDQYPEGNVEISLGELLSYMVSKSDNNACDILIHQLGGTHVVNDYIHEIGIRELSIQATEKEMAEAWEIQFNNWTTPIAITELLKKVYEGTILKSQSLDFLNRILTETTTGPNRIKGQLPPGTLVAHKTGTSGTNKAGITAAINDIGIIQLPDKTKVALSVFICNSSETLETNEKIIADIAKLVWNYFVKGKE